LHKDPRDKDSRTTGWVVADEDRVLRGEWTENSPRDRDSRDKLRKPPSDFQSRYGFN